jgi:Cytochrome b5-like Heme/Steroid binding domain
MAEEFKGSLWKKAPPRDVDRKGAENWLRVRSTEEGAEGLWRIHNKLYDLSSYIKIHPGGSEWLELTKVGLINITLLALQIFLQSHTCKLFGA